MLSCPDDSSFKKGLCEVVDVVRTIYYNLRDENERICFLRFEKEYNMRYF